MQMEFYKRIWHFGGWLTQLNKKRKTEQKWLRLVFRGEQKPTSPPDELPNFFP